MLFLRVPWKTDMPFQLGEKRGPNPPNPSPSHPRPARSSCQMVPTAGQSTKSTTHPYPACLGGIRFIERGQTCILGWKLVDKTWWRIWWRGRWYFFTNICEKVDVTCSQPFPYTLYSPILSFHTCTSNKMSDLDHLCMTPKTKNTNCQVFYLSLEFTWGPYNLILDRSHIS